MFFPAFWLFSIAVGTDWGAGIAAFFMYLWYPYMAMKFLSRNDEKKTTDMEAALASGNLKISDFEIFAAIEIEEFEDEGVTYLLDIGENKTLCLTGQYLYEPIETGSFPSEKIRVLWHKTENFTFGIEFVGAKIIPQRKLPPVTENQIKSGVIPGDREVVSQNLQSLTQLIEKNASEY